MTNDWSQRGIRRAKTGALAVIILAFGGFGGWSATAPMSGAVIAPGVVKVLTNRKAVQHREGGIIKEILVSDGDRVTVGAVVIRLDATRARNSHNLLRARRDHILATIARLQAELRGDKAMADPNGAEMNETERNGMLKHQRELLTARLQMLASSEAMIDEKVEQLKQEIVGLESKVSEQTYQIKSIGGEIDDLQALYTKGLTPRSRLLELQRKAAQLRGQRAEAKARIGASRRSMAEAKQQQSRTRAEFHERANRELNESQRQLHEIIEQLESAAHSLAQSEIRATASGIIVGLAVHTVGGVITPGDTLLEILPEAETLVIESEIQVKDIDLVYKGQPVDIQFVSSRARSLEKHVGKLAYVSADSMHDEKTGRSFFIARAEIDKNTIDPEMAEIVQPGLAAELFIKSKARTPLQYLVSPLQESIARAWREN